MRNGQRRNTPAGASASLQETAYLMATPANARRLHEAIEELRGDNREDAHLDAGVHCAYPEVVSTKGDRLHLRLDAEQKAMLEAASQAAGDTVSTFVLRAATEAAADVLADRRAFVLDQDAWQIFDDALQRPPQDVAGLRELLTGPTVLDPPPDGTSR